ncbi:MAG: peptide chain release factor N(5)-glutamine methyltransferase [Candidatus Marinimicrobia bacterium]|nr:peptide chain release factor N(5)-glutamine methyltransferase [Candidatus Neomarinimicrobiota bacterium]
MPGNTVKQTSDAKKVWRIIELINWTADYLKDRDFPSPRTDVEWLLTSVLDCSRMQLYADFQKPLTPSELAKFKSLLKQRLEHKPVQYIIGQTEFMGLPFQVDERVLIPRPETEILVEHAVDWLRKQPQDSRKVLDVGTGSGCIAVSIAALVTGANVIATDVSEDALHIAKQNAELNKVTKNIAFLQNNILEADPQNVPFNLIVSNPPYISHQDSEMVQKDVLDYEPEIALFAEGNGLLFYEHFATRASGWLDKGGQIILEIGGDHQVDSVTEIFQDNSWNNVRIIKDYNQRGRILTATHSV